MIKTNAKLVKIELSNMFGDMSQTVGEKECMKALKNPLMEVAMCSNEYKVAFYIKPSPNSKVRMIYTNPRRKTNSISQSLENMWYDPITTEEHSNDKARFNMRYDLIDTLDYWFNIK